MDEIAPSRWLHEAGRTWHRVPVTELETAAIEVWRNEELRELAPDEATARWLSPIGDH